MCQKNDLPLSLKSDTFNALASDFDQVLRATLQGMDETSQDTAEVNVKVKITLTPDSAPDYTVKGIGDYTRSITKPKFDHTVTAVIQRKEKKTGTLAGNYELVWDKESCSYVMRPIDNGQMDLFEGQQNRESAGDPRGLPPGPQEKVVDSDYTVLDEDQYHVDDAPKRTREEQQDAYNWLKQFVDDGLKVMEAMGNYTVRNGDNKVILSSATSQDAIFYASADVLAPHVGHSLVVTEGPDSIVIMCEDCDDIIYRIAAPAADLEEEPGDTQEDPKEEPEEPEEGKDADGEDGYTYDGEEPGEGDEEAEE